MTTLRLSREQLVQAHQARVERLIGTRQPPAYRRGVIANGRSYATAFEAAEALGVCENTIRDICNGKSSGERVGVKARWADGGAA